MLTIQPINMNDHLEFTKPVRKSFIKNGQHKKFSLQHYILLDYSMNRVKPTLEDG